MSFVYAADIEIKNFDRTVLPLVSCDHTRITRNSNWRLYTKKLLNACSGYWLLNTLFVNPIPDSTHRQKAVVGTTKLYYITV